jgi:hypothetical protein
MSGNEILFDIREWNRWLKDLFPDKDTITLEQLLGRLEDLVFEKEHYEEELEKLEQDYKRMYEEFVLPRI